jgi:hypothetical protein
MFYSKNVMYMLMLYLKLFLIWHEIKLFFFRSFTWQFLAFVSSCTRRQALLLAKKKKTQEAGRERYALY